MILPIWAKPENYVYTGSFGSVFALMTVFSFIVTCCICIQHLGGKVGTYMATSQFPYVTRGLNINPSQNEDKVSDSEIITYDSEMENIDHYLGIISHCLTLFTVTVFLYLVYVIWKRSLRWILFCQQKNYTTASTTMYFSFWDKELNTVSFPVARLPAKYKQLLITDNKYFCNEKIGLATRNSYFYLER